MGRTKAVGFFSPRSLVGMSQSARKRAARRWMECECLHQRTQELQESVDRSLGRVSILRTVGHTPGSLKKHYRIGQRLRPCPGCLRCRSCVGCEILTFEGDICEDCGRETPMATTSCDGSGVLPAKRIAGGR